MFVFIKVSALTTPIHRSSSCRELSCPKTRELLFLSLWSLNAESQEGLLPVCLMFGP